MEKRGSNRTRRDAAGTRGSGGGGEAAVPDIRQGWRRTANSTWGWGPPEPRGEDPEGPVTPGRAPRTFAPPSRHGPCRTRRPEPGLRDTLTSSKPPAPTRTRTRTSTAFGSGTRIATSGRKAQPRELFPAAAGAAHRAREHGALDHVLPLSLPGPPATLREPSPHRKGRPCAPGPGTGPGRATRSLRCQQARAPRSCHTPPRREQRALKSDTHRFHGATRIAPRFHTAACRGAPRGCAR